MKKHVVKVSIEIEAPSSRVWDALTRPEIVKKYFFGTTVDTDWQPGSPIFFRGEWQGKSYEDKGKILDATPGRRVSFTYWSSFSGEPDVPENYKTVTYELESRGKGTLLTLTQDNNTTEEARQHSEQNWRMVFDGLKKLVDG